MKIDPNAPAKDNDIIPETVAEALALWDAGRSVFSVSMGGLGPGYEQCIQILAFELMRVWLPTLPWPALSKDENNPDDKALSERLRALSDPVVSRLDKDCLGFSGAQVGAAQSLAACVCRRGYRAALRDPVVEDRLIQVSRRMPVAPPPPELNKPNPGTPSA